ncbi:MAG TPA: hypothetical protein VFL91_27185 [Thermomicrobiales bacterium]|nr:hypothetical protein [Thermomicrobiales bacterium]
MKHRNTTPPKGGKTPQGPADPFARGYDWSHDHAHCVDCGTSLRPHLADGRCRECYRKRHDLPPLIADAPPPPPEPADKGKHRPYNPVRVLIPERRELDEWTEEGYRRLLSGD